MVEGFITHLPLNAADPPHNLTDGMVTTWNDTEPSLIGIGLRPK